MRDEPALASLASRAARGDEAALADLVRATQADVWRFLVHLVGRDEADDLTQETYLRALRSLRSLRSHASVRAWLLTIARRVAVAHIKSARHDRDLTRRMEAGWAGSTPARLDLADQFALNEAIRDLEPDRRTAFVLTQILGLSYEEAAQVCRVPVGTIRSRVARARDDLVAGLGAEPGRRDKRRRRR